MLTSKELKSLQSPSRTIPVDTQCDDTKVRQERIKTQNKHGQSKAKPRLTRIERLAYKIERRKRVMRAERLRKKYKPKVPKQKESVKIDPLDLDRSICRQSFYEFVKEFWSTISQEEPVWNWHIKFLCDEIQEICERIFAGEDREYDLVDNQPPGTTKSTIFSVMLPAWAWTRMPRFKFIGASYSEDLARDDLSLKTRDVVRSDRYRELFPEIEWRSDQDTKSFYVNTRGGWRYSVGVNGSVTGKHAHCFPYSTLLTTNCGKLPIGEVVENRLRVKVLSFDHKTGMARWQPIREYGRSQGRQLCRVRFGDGTHLDCTLDHPVYSHTRKEYVGAESLQPKEEVIFHAERKAGHAPEAQLRTLREFGVATGLGGSERPEEGEPGGGVPVLSRLVARDVEGQVTHGTKAVVAVELLVRLPEAVYNLDVAEDHNYFAEGVLVHNCIVLDDPLNPKQAASQTDIKTATYWIKNTLWNRTVNKRVSVRLLVMQRLHQDDPTAFFLSRKKVRHIKLPAEITDTVKPFPPYLEENYEDGLLDPVLLSRSVLQDHKDLGEFYYAGQFDQNPVPTEGGMFKVDRLKWGQPPAPSDYTALCRFWDKAGTAGGGAYTVGTLIGMDRFGRFWVLDVVRFRKDSWEREHAIRDTADQDYKKYGRRLLTGVEQEPGSGGKESVSEDSVIWVKVKGKLRKTTPAELLSLMRFKLDSHKEGRVVLRPVGNLEILTASSYQGKTAKSVFSKVNYVMHHTAERRKLYRVTLTGGHSVVVTDCHSLMTTTNGSKSLKLMEKRVSDLIIGKDQMLVPTVVRGKTGHEEVPNWLCRLGGLWVGDGCYVTGRKRCGGPMRTGAIVLSTGHDPYFLNFVESLPRVGQYRDGRVSALAARGVGVGLPSIGFDTREEVIEDMIVSGRARNEGNATVRVKSNGDAWVYDSGLVDWMKSLGFSGYSETKRVPRWLFTASKEQIGLFLAGHFDADAHVSKFGVVLGSCNRPLLEDVRNLLLRIGIVSSINGKVASEGRNGREFWRLAVETKEGMDRFVNTVPSWKVIRRRPEKPRIGWPRRDFQPRLVQSVECVGEGRNSRVFDFGVVGSEMFVANGVLVHNSAENTATRTLKGYRVRIVKVDKTTGGKEERADPWSVQVNRGNVYLPWSLRENSQWTGWAEPWVEEHKFFPVSKTKDQVDSAALAFSLCGRPVMRIGGGEDCLGVEAPVEQDWHLHNLKVKDVGYSTSP